MNTIMYQDQIKDALGQMKYRRFWHRDHERKVDVVCVRFPFKYHPCKKDGCHPLIINNPVDECRKFVSFLNEQGIQAHVHHGPTGGVFGAIVCSDEARQKLEAI